MERLNRTSINKNNRSQVEVSGKIFFEETQQFRVKWVWAIIILCVVSSMGITVGVAMTEKGNMREGLIALAITAPIELIMLYLFYVVRLEIAVTSEGIYYRWWPFQRKPRFISKTAIAAIEIKKGPGMQYGVHRVPGYGKVHNTGPGEGLQFVLHDGKKLFLGSGMPASFSQALARIVNVSRKV